MKRPEWRSSEVIKLAVVGKWEVLLAVPFFVGHFGGFMAIHFLFIYYFFVRGLGIASPRPVLPPP